MIKVYVREFDINPLYSVSLPDFTWQCGLKCTDINLQTFQNKDKTSKLFLNFRGEFHEQWVVDMLYQMIIK